MAVFSGSLLITPPHHLRKDKNLSNLWGPPQNARWLSGVQDLITGLPGDPTVPDPDSIGYGDFDARTVSAFTGNNPKQTDLPAGFAVAINSLGAFFVGTYTDAGRTLTLTANGYGGGTSQALVAMLLHELAHILNNAGLGAVGFQHDFNNQKAGANNDQMIRKNYQGTLNAARSLP